MNDLPWRSRARLGVLFGILAAGALAGCGDDDDGGGNVAGSPSSGGASGAGPSGNGGTGGAGGASGASGAGGAGGAGGVNGGGAGGASGGGAGGLGGAGAGGGATGVGFDPTFGEQGVVEIEAIQHDYASFRTLGVDAQSRIYVGGVHDEAPLARLLPDGSLDPSFGQGGVVKPGHSGFFGNLMRPQPTGQVFLAGDDYQSGGLLTFLHLNADGSPDPAFGFGGAAVPPFPFGNAYTTLSDLGVWGDRLVALGYNNTFEESSFGLFVLRLRADGSRDPSLGGPGGIVFYNPSSPAFFSAYAAASTMRVRADGSMLLVGAGYLRQAESDPPDGSDCFLLRMGADGVPDPSLDGDGALYVAARSEDNLDYNLTSCSAVDEGPDGSIVLGGQVALPYDSNGDGERSDFVIMRRLPDGSPDLAFAQQGIFVLHVGYADSILGVIAAPDGSVVAVGKTDNRPIVIKLLPNGALDTSFQGGGIFYERDRYLPVETFARQPDGKLLVGGSATSATFDQQPFVARLFAP
jgi:uncharacterized delta-60 repeat protein